MTAVVDELTQLLVQKLNLINNGDQNELINSVKLASEMKLDHQKVVGVVKSLQSMQLIEADQVESKRLELTAEGRQIVSNGSHEYLVWSVIPESAGLEQAELMKKISDPVVGKLGFTKAMTNKWIAIDKSSGKPVIIRKMSTVIDEVQQFLQLVQNDSADKVMLCYDVMIINYKYLLFILFNQPL